MRFLHRHIDERHLRLRRLVVKCFLFLGLCLLTNTAWGQAEELTDSTSALIKTESAVDSVRQDSLERHSEISPLDIGRNRGLFILSSDKLMQMRILGSVRALFAAGDRLLESQNTFNQLEIPTDGSRRVTNFYAGLSQTRLGFEVTRRTRQFGDLFLRIEADFAGNDGNFRIRHAYGQVKNVIIGQTWSLFSNVQYLPPTVDVSGPSGSIGIRTPQIRYFRTINEKMSWFLGVEYSTPTITAPDSVDAELVQVIPDLTGRLDYIVDNLSFQFVFVIATLSGRNRNIENSPVHYQVAHGFSMAVKYNLANNGTLYFSGTTGRGISHYIDLFDGKGLIASYNGLTERFDRLPVHAAYLGYSIPLPQNFSLNAALGFGAITNYGYQAPDSYDYSYNGLLNIFWQPVDGARLGVEFTHGKHVTVNTSKGTGNRISFLIYYDF